MAAIQGNMDAVEAGLKPVAPLRPVFVPYQKRPKLTGFMALYAHYLYILGKIEKRTYPPRMTPKMRADVMRFEKLKAQFAFVRENNLTTREGYGGVSDESGGNSELAGKTTHYPERAEEAAAKAVRGFG